MPPAEDVRFEGVVERIAGSTITGWARRVDTIDPVNVELLVGDAVAAAASADRLRLDLKENGKGEGKHAFVFQLPDAGQSFDWKTVSLRIKGSSFVLPISKTARGAAQAEGAPEPVGYVERVSPDGLSGWACIPNSAERLTIEAVIDGVVAASAVADAPRHDLAAAGVGDGRHGFKLTLPASRFAGKTLRLRLQDGRSLATLDTSLATKLARFSVEPQAASPAPAVIPARGALLGVQDGWLVGWARLEQGRTGILVTVDSRVIGETAATGLPPSAPALKLEVRGAGVPDSGVPDSGAAELAAHGFRIEVPRPLRTGARRRVLIYDAASGARINGGGQLIVFPATAEAPVARAPAPARIEPSRPLEPIAASKVTPLRAAAPATSKTLRRVAVVAWDMAHNPVGRAFLLADMAARGHEVELIGPTFAFYGGRIWPPIAGSEMRMTSFPASDLRSLVAGAVDVAMNVVCDLVVVCKPRLPSLLIGALIRNANNCPMILDIDDHELSFVKDRRPASFDELLQELSKDPTLADTPHSDLWTRFAHSLIPETEGRIVSNVALRREFGGIIVRYSPL